MKISPQELRARMAAGYLTGYRSQGINVSASDMERQAIADCELIDAARRSGDLNERPKAKSAPKPKRPDVLAQAQHETGTKLVSGGSTVRFRAIHGNPFLISERWGRAMKRVSIICDATPPEGELVATLQGSHLEALAKEIQNVFGHWLNHYKVAPVKGTDRNPFRGKSDEDAIRILMRLIEDICDRSTGRLGDW